METITESSPKQTVSKVAAGNYSYHFVNLASEQNLINVNVGQSLETYSINIHTELDKDNKKATKTVAKRPDVCTDCKVSMLL